MSDDTGALFPVAAADAGYRPGRVEQNLVTAIEAATKAGTLVPEDAGMVGAALVAARKLDRSDADPNPKAGYLVAQLLTPYREVLQALRLPAALTPVSAPLPAADGHTGAPDWLSDEFGTAQ